MQLKLFRQQGVSLIEMMIAMTLGLLLLAAISSLSLTNLFTSTDSQRNIILQQDAQAMLSLISRDIRRAGYHPQESEVANTRKIWLPTRSNSQTCVIYRYHNPDFPGKDIHGFQYATPTDGSNNGFIQMLTSDTATGCNDGSWQALNSNRNLLITQFTITPRSAFEKSGTETKEVISNLEIVLEATDNAGKFKVRLNQDVQLRNRPFLQE